MTYAISKTSFFQNFRVTSRVLTLHPAVYFLFLHCPVGEDINDINDINDSIDINDINDISDISDISAGESLSGQSGTDAHFIVYTQYCILNIAHCTLNTAHCTLHT